MEETNQQSQSPTPANPTLPAVNSGKSKVIPIIVGIAAAIVIAIGAYALGTNQTETPVLYSTQTTPIPSPTPVDETVNWKTYTGEKFSFSHPPSMKLLNRQGSVAVTFKEEGAPDGCEFCYGYELDFKYNPLGSKSIKEIVDDEINDQKKNGAEIVEPLKNITIADYSGYTYASVLQIQHDYLYIPDKIGNYIKITKLVSDPNNLGHEATVGQILSTFKFITTDTQTNIRTITYKKTSGWTDFISQVGYSLQHPQNLKPVFQILQGDQCTTTISGQGNVGFIIAIVKPYDGGSRRTLLGTAEGSKYDYEDVFIQEKQSLLRQETSSQEPTSVAAAVVPVGNQALILSWSKETITSINFNTLLQSLKLPNEFDLLKCNAINNP